MKKLVGSKLRKFLCGVMFMGSLVCFSQQASAISTLPTTGKCGFVMTHHYPFAYTYGSSPGSGWGMNFLGTIDFDANTISFNIVTQNPAGVATTEAQVQKIASFTISRYASGHADSTPLIIGSYTISFLISTGVTQTINLIPVNGGNTILMQGFNSTAGNQDAGSTGVCQF